MKLLLHTCCAPCLTGSRIPFEDEGYEITAFFYNPNIHPFTEYNKRLQALERYAYISGLDLIVSDDYPYKEFIEEQVRTGISKVENGSIRPARCTFCYRERLERTAEHAKKMGFDSFTSTMLLSKYQDHELIKRLGEEISDEMDIPFEYRDLRNHWKDSIRISKELRIYRQSYCGCIFSEGERYLEQ